MGLAWAWAPPGWADVERGRELSVQHCARCHVIGDYNRMGGLDNSPSFMTLTTVDGYEERVRTFYARRPHPVFVRVEGYERWSNAPAYAPEFEITSEQIGHILDYIRTLVDWKPPSRR